MKQRIYLSSPHLSGNEVKYLQEAMDTNWVAPVGPNVDAFEKEIASYVGAKGAVAVSSGTAAIHLALSLVGVQRDDIVFCSSLTFVASANPILYQGAVPVFIDSEPESWNMSPQALARALKEAAVEGKLPKAVVVVNLYGQSAMMDEITTLCEQYNIPIIEDAAESLGATYKGQASGTFGKFGIYSFNGNKIITTSSGGMLVSDDLEALRKARFLATQARDEAPHYQHSTMGYNYRMSNVLAGIGRGQLELIEERVTARRSVFSRYLNELGPIKGLQFMPEMSETKSNRWLTVLTIDEREAGISSKQLLSALASENIEARPVWKPLHLQPLFESNKYYPHEVDGSVSDRLFKTGICLPSGSNMKEDQIERVVDCVRNTINQAIHV